VWDCRQKNVLVALDQCAARFWTKHKLFVRMDGVRGELHATEFGWVRLFDFKNDGENNSVAGTKRLS
jgi:hypothetical protein